MIRFSVPAGEYLANSTHFSVHAGGAESNTCAALARLGRRTGWFSALPDTSLGKFILTRLNKAGVDTRGVFLTDDGRVGTYYLQSLHPPLANTVEYDRSGSAFSMYGIEDIDLDRLLDTRIIHLTGITPALGARPREAFLAVVQEAKRRGVLVSFDVNYRERLWSLSEARVTLTGPLRQADIVFCSLRDAIRLFGSPADEVAAAAVLRELTDARLIVISLGERGILAHYDGRNHILPAVPTTVIDRPGAGDALAAGILHGVLDDDIPRGLKHGTVLASIALSHFGDKVLLDPDQLKSVLAGQQADITR